MVDTDDTRRTTDVGRRTTDDGRRTTPWVWHKLPTGELKIYEAVENCLFLFCSLNWPNIIQLIKYIKSTVVLLI